MVKIIIYLFYFVLDVARRSLQPGEFIAVYPDPESGDPYWLAQIAEIRKRIHAVYLERVEAKVFKFGETCQLSLGTVMRQKKGLKRFFLIKLESREDGLFSIGEDADNFLRSSSL